MTAADVPIRAATRAADSVVAPLGVREVIEAGLFVGPIAFDIDASATTATLADLEHDIASRTLMIVAAGDGAAVPPMPIGRTDLAVALRVPPHAHAGGLMQLSRTVEQSLEALGIDRFDVLLLDGVDPFDHPASVADRAAAVLAAGTAGALGVTDHSEAQVRALCAHLPADLHLGLIGVALADVSLTSMQQGGLDLALELGTVALVECHDRLRLPSRGAVDPESLAVLLHHPARPVLVVGHDDLAGRAIAADALLRRLDRATIHRLLDA